MQNDFCPACSSHSNFKLSDFDFNQDGKGYFSNTYNILKCNSCGLVFKNNIPEQKALLEYYKSLPADHTSWDYGVRLPHEKKIDEILTSLPERASVLDVGCWKGRLLAPHNHCIRYGIEPNKKSALAAKQYGINIISDQVTQSALEGHSFDLITMVDVFEHLNRPLETIELLYKCLKPGGKIVIVTGMGDSLPFKITGITYWYMSLIPDHIVFMNRDFINYLKTHFQNCKIKFTVTRHYPYTLKGYLWETSWLIIWRYFNPNSPFPKNSLIKIITPKRIKNLKEIMICRHQKDHVLLQILRR